ncbi:tail fiber assembly protein [Pseudomonas multiresinivorans]|uniref:Tail fiber assembly protein n=1 Tax=Pseudomonas multiresinivorans TaxID=95301 RepID=A0A7Z3GT65_9PSED|nr:tail fiber assembly protein [Pseudomonas multiresinivorans]QJP11838.1 tail fiber assembly protein [Pseudomonas multiresinivorans]
MLNFLKASQPFWVDEAQTGISLLVTFEGLGEVPFTATPNDGEAHGREIFQKAIAGEFGDIAPCAVPTSGQLIAEISYQKSHLLQQAAEKIAPLQDSVELGIATPEEIQRLHDWKVYRVEVNRVEQQPHYPQTLMWPQLPEQ